MKNEQIKLKQKSLGAFYTPELYAVKSHELLRRAIAEVPEGNDYVILDRCAGTGNLEKQLSEEELSHVIISTIDYNEWKILKKTFEKKVRHILPENPTVLEDNTIRESDALNEEFVKNPLILDYLKNPNCSFILFENPPFNNPSGFSDNKVLESIKTRAKYRESFVYKVMKDWKKQNNSVNSAVLNNTLNLFIWSAFHFYLRQKGDAYILFAPPKYFKWQNLVNNDIGGIFGFNQKHFHASTNLIACVFWKFEETKKWNKTEIELWDITYQKKLVKQNGSFFLNKIHSNLFQELKKNIILEKVPSFGFFATFNHSSFDLEKANFTNLLTNTPTYSSNHLLLTKDNFLVLLAVFSAGCFSIILRDFSVFLYAKSGDKIKEFLADIKNGKLEQFLLKNLLFSSLVFLNHIQSFRSEEKVVKNEICLDESLGKTIAVSYLSNLAITKKEQKILDLWFSILTWAKSTKNYNPNLNYGVYQIEKELNTFSVQDEKRFYTYPVLNFLLKDLKLLLKDYYLTEILPVLFEYELLK